ncbi:MAG TPA: hypothetical protein VG871_00495 [Vicinamibacterales bacterium]|nr:hypothetical protein [Vicinamibacterales bacterium]
MPSRTAALVSVVALLAAACSSGGSSPSTPSAPSASSASTRVIGLSGSLAFGTVTIGQSAHATLTITNSGSQTLNVSGMTVPAGSGGVYFADWTSGAILPAASKDVSIRFTPLAAQSYSGVLTVNGDQTSGTNTIPISGSGTSESSSAPTPSPTPPSTSAPSAGPWTFVSATSIVCQQPGKDYPTCSSIVVLRRTDSNIVDLSQPIVVSGDTPTARQYIWDWKGSYTSQPPTNVTLSLSAVAGRCFDDITGAPTSFPSVSTLHIDIGSGFEGYAMTLSAPIQVQCSR